MIKNIHPSRIYVLGQRRVERSKVLEMIKALEQGEVFQPIKVLEYINNPGYYTARDGCHRAAAHYLINKEIKADIFPNKRDKEKIEEHHISNMSFLDGGDLWNKPDDNPENKLKNNIIFKYWQ